MNRTIAALLVVLASRSAAAEPRPIPRDAVPPALAPAVSRGEAAMDAFRDRLFARLNELIVQGGPVHAIQVCRVDAPALARQLGADHHVTLGRTSHRLRNPANAPRPWARASVAAGAGKATSEVKSVVFDLGDRVGVLRPLAVMPACTRCHGAPDGIDPDVRAELARTYPSDQATGFAPGDLRGFMWVEVPKR